MEMNAAEQQESKDRKKGLVFSLGVALMSLNCSINGFGRITKPTSAPLFPNTPKCSNGC